jgi:hypothetical protein
VVDEGSLTLPQSLNTNQMARRVAAAKRYFEKLEGTEGVRKAFCPLEEGLWEIGRTGWFFIAR